MRAITLALAAALTFVSSQVMALTATLRPTDWYNTVNADGSPISMSDRAPTRVVAIGTNLSWRISDLYELPAGLNSSCNLRIAVVPKSMIKAGTNWTESPAAGLNVAGAGVGAGATSANGGSNINTNPFPSLGFDSMIQFTGTSESTITASFIQSGTYEVSAYIGLATACNGVAAQTLNTSGRIFVKVVTTAEAATPETGWYYDPSQNGRGFAVQLNPATNAGFVGLFGYGNDGRADWYVSDCRFDPVARSCVGVLRAFNSGPTLSDYTGPVAAVTGITGNFSIVWPGYDGTAASNRQATMSFAGNVRSIIRYPLPGTSETNGSASSDIGKDAGLTTGWYLGQGESGRGYFMETTRIKNAVGATTGFSLYGVAFMYRADGSPTWYIFTNVVNSVSPTRVLDATSLLEFAGGTAFSNTSGAWTAPSNVPSGSAGNVTLSMGAATMLYLPGQRAKQLNSFLPSIR